MKRFAMAVALKGLMSVTALAGNVPTNDVVSLYFCPTKLATCFPNAAS